VLFVKSAIWIISLGSGTSGGVLAPLLMMGAALGGGLGMFLPNFGLGFWPLIGMGAILGGTMRSPFTGVVFAIELTHDLNMLLPLVVGSFLAHGFTVLTLKRSILTEKIARRGYHLSREYAVDPLEILFVREVMRTNVVALPAETTLEQSRELIRPSRRPHGQHVFPIIDANMRLLGVVSRNYLLKRFEESQAGPLNERLRDIMSQELVTAFEDEPLRVVVYRMAETGFTRLPVVDADDERRLLGMVSLDDLLRARSRNLEEERTRERTLRLRLPLSGRSEAGKLAIPD
jgi:CBS domain-containing protein